MYDAIVIGGGIIGVSAAYHLAAGGARTLLIDRADYGRATDAAAGIIAPVFGGFNGFAPWEDWMARAVEYYPHLLEKIGGDTGFARCGALLVAISAQEALAFNAARPRIRAYQERHHLSAENLREISSQEARALFPYLGEVRAAYYDRQAARVDGRQLAQALRDAGEAYGLVILDTSVEKIIRQHNQVSGVLAGGDMYPARKFVLAGGAWSRRFGRQLGLSLPVDPQRGQIIHLDTRLARHDNAPIVMAISGHYVVPWKDKRVVVGATHESGAGFNAFTTASGIHEVLTEGLRIAPGLRDAQLHEARVGLRPVPHDGLPVMGTMPGIDNLYLAIGHGAFGIQLGPYSGKLVADWALGADSTLDMSAFSIMRFAGGV